MKNSDHHRFKDTLLFQGRSRQQGSEGRGAKGRRGKVQHVNDLWAVIWHHANIADVALQLGCETVTREAMEALNLAGKTGPVALHTGRTAEVGGPVEMYQPLRASKY